MPTLIYSPGVRCYIQSEAHGPLDVSDDLTGTAVMVRRVDGVSTWDFSLMNPRRKYDRAFTPNDRVIVMMKRITWLRTFSGLLNTVPLKTIWPQEVPLSASCTLKRLQYFYWDPNNTNTQTMIYSALSEGTLEGTPEGGVISAMLAILEKVVGWDTKKVHVGKIPDDWYQIAIKIAQQVDSDVTESDIARDEFVRSINPGAIFGGESASATGATSLPTTSGLSLGASGFVGTLTSPSFDGITIDDDQRINAELICSTAWELLTVRSDSKGSEAKAMTCALMTSMTETGLRNLASQAVPESLAFPHDTYPDGSTPSGDHDSVGLFQQRAPWGSVKDRMNPHSSTSKFLAGGSGGQQGLLDKAGWKTQEAGSLCQSVQVSAYPDRYAKYERMAGAMVTEMVSAYQTGRAPSRRTTPSAQRVGPGSTSARRGRNVETQNPLARPGVASGSALLGEALNLVERYPNIPYSQQYGGTQVDILAKEPPPGLDCSSFVQAVILRTVGNLGGCPRTSSAQASWVKRITTDQALKTPGALLFKSSNGQPSGVFHVEMSLGDGTRTVGAHRTGVPAGVASSGSGYWSFGGLIPSLVYGADGTVGAVGSSGGTVAGGTGQYPVNPHPISAAYKKPGSWAAGYHTGVDFAVGSKTPVVSVANGTVVSADSSAWGADYGNHLVVQYGDYRVAYCHLHSFAPGLTAGASLATGASVGLSGNTGRTTGPHLHFEVRKAPFGYGDDVDPISFITSGLTSSGSVGTGTEGPFGTSIGGETTQASAILDFPPASELPGYNPDDPIDQLFGDNMWRPVFSDPNDLAMIQANALTGVRALLNDQPILPYIKNLLYSTMRSFCSAPNGDLIAWFPDYYGLWGTASKLRLEPIEMLDFNVFWSDDQFVTHQFTQAGTYNSLDLATGDASSALVNDALYATTTVGIANIDMPAILESLFGVEPTNASDFTAWIYRKFGARPHFYPAVGLYGPKAELFSAIHMFMIQWAYQYRSDVPITFMPEAWPGMLLQVPRVDFQAYITTVTHCQPAGTMVRVPVEMEREAGTSRWRPQGWREVPIETLAPGDKVVSWNPRNGWLSKRGKEVSAIATRPHDGEIVVATVGDKVSKYSPNHYCVVNLGSSLTEGNHVVYLMRRNGQYRVGRSVWRYGNGNGAIRRACVEDADALWILSAHETKAEAALWEALNQTQFGLPSCSFVDQSHFAMDLGEYWSKIGDNRAQAEACLARARLLIEEPLWSIDVRPLGRGSVQVQTAVRGRMVTAAANLRAGMRMLDVERGEWTSIKVSREWYTGLIYSMEVEGDHTYVADGVLTHNSIVFGEGGGYETSLNLAAPAYMPRGGKAKKSHALFGLPLAGGYHPGRGVGSPPSEAYGTEPLPPSGSDQW